MIYIGDRKLKSCYLGDEKVAKVYRGDELLFQKKPTHNLPQGYTELEYVEAAGNQRIDLGYYVNSFCAIYMDVELSSSGSGSFWGGTTNAKNTSSYLSYSTGSNGLTTIQSAIGAVYTEAKSLEIAGKRSVIIQNKITRKMEVDGSLYDLNIGVPASRITFVIFQTKYTSTSSTTPSYSSGFRGKIYEWKLSTLSTGEYNFDYIPCLRNSDNIAGFYDLKNNVFRYSSSGVHFIAGPAI